MKKSIENSKESSRPAQVQEQQPGIENIMQPRPEYEDPNYKGSDKLLDKVAIITGGDSGIGRAIAVSYAIEGADIVIAYLNEHDDAEETKALVESKGRKCVMIAGDVRNYKFCKSIVDITIQEFKRLDILINNSAVQYPEENFEKIDLEKIERTFYTNIISYFYLTKAALPHLKKGSCIINTSSVTAYKGNPSLVDYSATKGAVISFTRSLSENLVKKGIRVNAVAPGPIWTPLIPASFPAEKVQEFGSQVPMGRAGEPKEIAPCYVFLASEDASYISGQTLHPNGGVIVSS